MQANSAEEGLNNKLKLTTANKDVTSYQAQQLTSEMALKR